MFRTAIAAEILFAARVMQVRFLKRLSGKTPPEQNSSGKKIGAESAVLHFVFFEVIVNKMQQSAKRKPLIKKKHCAGGFSAYEAEAEKRSLLKRDMADARSEEKLTAGVSMIR